MNQVLKVAAAGAVVVFAILVGLSLLSAKNEPTSAAKSLAPTQVASPSLASPSPARTQPPSSTSQPSSVATLEFPAAGELEVGRHSMTREGVTFSIDVPTPGWTSDGSFLIRSSQRGAAGAVFIFWTDTPDGAYDDPCAHLDSPPVDPSASELARDITMIPGIEVVRPPTDITIGGYPGAHVAISVPPGTVCESGSTGFYLWYDELIGGRWADSGTTVNAWIIDVDGQLVWIDAEVFAGGDPPLESQVLQIVDSIEFQ